MPWQIKALIAALIGITVIACFSWMIVLPNFDKYKGTKAGELFTPAPISSEKSEDFFNKRTDEIEKQVNSLDAFMP